MIRVENKEIEFSTDKFTLITETLFLLDNLKEIADLDEEEVERIAAIAGDIIRGNSKHILKKQKKKIIDNLMGDLGIKRITAIED